MVGHATNSPECPKAKGGVVGSGMAKSVGLQSSGYLSGGDDGIRIIVMPKGDRCRLQAKWYKK